MRRMHVGKISINDIGRWFLTDEKEEVELIGFVGNLLRCKTKEGVVLLTVFDILKPVSNKPGHAKQPEEVVKKNTQTNRGAGNRKAVVATDCNGNETRYVSLFQASQDVGVHVSSICRSLKEKRAVKGLTWRYESTSPSGSV